MYVAKVTDGQTGLTYHLERLLGAGATAQVWYGVPQEDGGGTPVAVKIAREGTPPEELAAFKTELGLPGLLAAYRAEHHLPWMHRGHAAAAPQAFCVIMELIPDAWQLSRLAAEAGGRLPEHLALESGLQFAQLLQALHAMALTMRGDRKATDFRWDDAERRLIVIDWNRAAPIPPSTPPGLREELQVQDLRVFGQIWSELILGRAVVDLPAVDDIQDAAWATISRGFRAILSQTLGRRTGLYYTEAGALSHDLDEQLNALLAVQEGRIEQLVSRAEQARTSAEQAAPAQRLAQIHLALNLCDLIARRPEASVYAARIEPIVAWGQTQLASVDSHAARVITQINEELDLDQYREAARTSDEAINELSDHGPQARPAILQLMRWRSIAQVGLTGNERGENMGAVVSLLRRVVNEIEAMPIGAGGSVSAAQKLHQVAAQLDEQLHPLPEAIRIPIRALVDEINLRRRLEASLRAEVHNVPTAAEQAAQVRTDWHQLYAHDNLYADHLRTIFPELDRLLRREQHGHAIAESTARSQRELQRLEDELTSALRQPGPVWPVVSETLAQARETLQLLDALRPDDQQPPQAAPFLALSQINDLVAQSQLLEAFAVVGKLLKHPLLSLAHQRLTELAVARVEQIVSDQDGSTWPVKLEEAEHLLALTEQGGRQLPRQLAADLRELRAIHDRLRKTVEPLLHAPPALLEPGDDDRQQILDAVLSEAAEARIELIDRRMLPPGEVERFRVKSLRHLRALRRTTAYHTNRIAELRQQLREVIDRLCSDAETLELTQQRLSSLLQQNADYQASSVQEQVSATIAKLRTQVDAFAEVRGHIPSPAQIDEIDQQILECEMRLRSWNNRVTVISQLSSRLREWTGNVQTAEQPLAAALCQMWYTLGMHAVSVLNVQAARENLSSLQVLRQSAGQTPGNAQETSLRSTLAALELLERDTVVWADLVEWHKAIKTRNAAQAQTYARQLRGPFRQDPARFQSWVIDQLRLQHRELCGDDLDDVAR